jgi:hypothetical protein
MKRRKSGYGKISFLGGRENRNTSIVGGLVMVQLEFFTETTETEFRRVHICNHTHT